MYILHPKTFQNLGLCHAKVVMFGKALTSIPMQTKSLIFWLSLGNAVDLGYKNLGYCILTDITYKGMSP